MAMGFSSADRMSAEAWQLWKRIEVGEALPAGDWRQVLLVAEIVLVSDLVGSGLDWSITSEISPTRILLRVHPSEQKPSRTVVDWPGRGRPGP